MLYFYLLLQYPRWNFKTITIILKYVILHQEENTNEHFRRASPKKLLEIIVLGAGIFVLSWKSMPPHLKM